MRAKLKILMIILCLLSSNAYANNYTTYYIDYNHNDELFIISGAKFTAMTYCFNMQEGDPVIFIDGNIYGACAIARILNLRTKQDCQLWCEY